LTLPLPAIVLTAGLGTRLDPITRLVAKAAVPLAGQTLIERLLVRLRDQGVTDAVLNLHHRPETVTGIVGDGAHLGLRIKYSWERTILGSAGGPRRALSLLGADTFLIVNGDTLCDVDLSSMVAAHQRTGADITMAVVRNPAPDHYNGIRLDGDGRVTAFVPKGQAAGTWHFIGVQIARAAVFSGVADGVPDETVARLYRDRIASGEAGVFGYPVDQPFVDVGTPMDYLEAALRSAAEANAIEPGASVASSATLDRSVAWAEAVVGAGAQLSECIVTNVCVPAGLRASRRILVPAAVRRPEDDAEAAGDIALFPLTR
jgi:mannose-1-phosphate guanylyltransferase